MSYIGYSMSENAAIAYDLGLAPLSKWTKARLIDAIEYTIVDKQLQLQCDLERLKSMPLRILKSRLLECCEWHHTSKYFNKTDFYGVDTSVLEEVTDIDLDEWLAEDAKAKVKAADIVLPEPERWRCEYEEWYGSRRYGRFRKFEGTGVVKGNWFYFDHGGKKLVSGNHFRLVERID